MAGYYSLTDSSSFFGIEKHFQWFALMLRLCQISASTPFFSDLNECGLKPRPCKHRCMNTYGSYKCYCLNGYMLMPDGSCSSMSRILTALGLTSCCALGVCEKWPPSPPPKQDVSTCLYVCLRNGKSK